MRWSQAIPSQLINSSERKKQNLKHLLQDALCSGIAHRRFLLSKAICVLDDLSIQAVKKVVEFDALEESLFPFIISNFPKSTVS